MIKAIENKRDGGRTMLAKDIMTKDVKMLKADNTIKDAVEMFAKNGITGAPVVDDESHILGIFTDVDIVKSMKVRYPKLSMVYPSSHVLGVSFNETIEYRDLMDAFFEVCNNKVGDVMSAHPITVGPETNVGEILYIMITKKINRLPVVKDDVVLGIITRMDVTKRLAELASEHVEKKHKQKATASYSPDVQ